MYVRVPCLGRSRHQQMHKCKDEEISLLSQNYKLSLVRYILFLAHVAVYQNTSKIALVKTYRIDRMAKKSQDFPFTKRGRAANSAHFFKMHCYSTCS